MRRFKPKPSRPSSRLLEQREFTGHVHRLTWESEDGMFKIVGFRTPEGEEFKAKGKLYGVTVGQALRMSGAWKEDPNYGWTFVVENFVLLEPETEDALLAYLGSGLIKGVGPRKAAVIIEHFGEKTIQVLDETPELLETVPGLGRKLARAVADQWGEHRASREAMIFMKKYGLSNAIAIRLLKHYGTEATAILKANPYRAGLEVRFIGFRTADEIAEKMGIARDSPERIQAAFVHVLDEASAEGHTFLPREDLLERAAGLLGLDHAAIDAVLADTVARSYIRRDSIGDRAECYFIPSLHQCESGLARLVLAVGDGARPLVPGDIDARITRFEQKYRFNLAPQQQDALRSVARGGLCVITGGPGTGKTTLVRALLFALDGTGVRFLLCSPTGRAAQRLSETTGKEAATVHRLLKWNAETGHFVHNEDDPLEADLVIVDEASMLDVPLAYALMRAVPRGASIVFVGDVDQLPSVGPGTFLRDLIQSGRARTTRLEVIFRQAEKSLIIRNSHRINQGLSLAQPPEGAADADFFFVERMEPTAVRDSLLTLVTERIPRRLGCDPVDGIQVLTPMRRGPLGVMELNILLQGALNPDGEPIAPGSPFRTGDKVIQTANNYDLDVYNGDVGRVTGRHPETRHLRVQFGRRTVYYPPENLDELELAYAITVHKSQGSEYPAVVLILHTSHYIMLKRNLIYTGVTRGKRLVVLLGNKRAVFKAIRTSPESERMTALEFWLSRPPASGDLLD